MIVNILSASSYRSLQPGNGAAPAGVYSLVKETENAEDTYRCGYCRVRLPFATNDTLRHVVRHLGESPYLAAFHRHLERRGYDELSAHLMTFRAAARLAHRPL